MVNWTIDIEYAVYDCCDTSSYPRCFFLLFDITITYGIWVWSDCAGTRHVVDLYFFHCLFLRLFLLTSGFFISPSLGIINDSSADERVTVIGLIPIPETLSRCDLGNGSVRPTDLAWV